MLTLQKKKRRTGLKKILILLGLTEPFHNKNLRQILPCFYVYRFQNFLTNVRNAIF